MSKCTKLIGAAVCAIAVLAAGTAAAAPVTYTAFVVTDVSLNGQMYHNAAVYLTFEGDTGNVTSSCFVVADCASTPPTPDVYQNASGTAKVRIVSGGRTRHATFLPNQIVVTYDVHNGGAGFSAYVGTGSNRHLEPAYPLGIDGSTVLFNMPDLSTTGAWSGHAWSCIGFPPVEGSGTCADPSAYPLQTDHGPLVVFVPYVSYYPAGVIWDDYKGSLNDGFFTTLVGN